MHIIYKITYIPHINTNYPKYYIGSKYNYKGNYLGSVSSTQIFEYTRNIPLVDWWKEEIKNKENFIFEILKSFEDITPIELIEVEKEFQLKYNVLNDNYFNQCIAASGFCSKIKSEATKRIMSEKTKAYWNSPEGLNKRKRLSERNKLTKSNVMKSLWENSDSPLRKIKYKGRVPGSKNKNVYDKPSKKVSFNGLVYDNALVASVLYKTTPQTIRRKCKYNIDGWKYL